MDNTFDLQQPLVSGFGASTASADIISNGIDLSGTTAIVTGAAPPSGKNMACHPVV